MVFKKGYKQTREHTERIIKAIIEQHKINPNYGMKNKKHSKETRIKIGLSSLRKKPTKTSFTYGFDERREKTKFGNTSIEIKIQNFLKQLGIEFYTHQYIKEIEHGYQCDILIPSRKLIIECDGNHWHKYPIGTEIDNIRNKELKEKGFKILRLWESEIKIMDIEDFRNKLAVLEITW